MDFLLEGLKELGIPAEFKEKLDSYIKTLLEFNAKFDLINSDTYDETAVKHILDSLSAYPELKNLAAKYENPQFADIGSGAGLPGIPLAIVFPEIHFTLVERMEKRCGFLNEVKSRLNLENVTIEENQAERLEQKRFDICVFRAFRPLEKKMTHVLRRILKDGGILAAYKAKKDKIEEEMQALGKNMPEYEVRPLTVPFLTENPIDGEIRERNLVLIRK